MKKHTQWISLLTTIIIVIAAFIGKTSNLVTFLAFSNKIPSNYEAIQIEIANDTIVLNGITYNIIDVEGGNFSGDRLPSVAVNIGFGDREYWGFTNEYGQLVYVYANEIILQDDQTEPVLSTGRYYSDEAKVPGTERPDLDQGHVIADSLGGVSNAYNITPQNSTLNRHGNQAYMEDVIRDANGCTDFFASITYPNQTTQIPSSYKFQYSLLNQKIVDTFENRDPEELAPSNSEIEELARIDTNQNGTVSISEAKDAGYKMPIYSDHWLYKYMNDADGDGKVGN